jgi:hypothetical protein
MAQVGYNYDQYDFGFSAAYNKAYTDFRDSKPKYAAMAHFTYNATPYVNYIAEVQIGSVTAQYLNALPDGDNRFDNTYSIVSFRAQLQMGELMDYSHSRLKNFFKNIYVSGGVGVVYSNIDIYADGEESNDNKGSSAFIPLKAGYEFKIFNSYNEPKVKLDIGYQFNYILSDNFDGFTAGKSDVFTQIVLGLKVSIGGTTSYRKSISY